jgi:pimeloyl-ACP methyl ester carboxylesterase
MNLIKTKSFKLAINKSGSLNSKKLAIALPGRLDTKDYTPFVSHIKYLSNKGFFAISFDPPGTWESPGEIELFTTTNYVKAVNELIDYYGNRPTFLIGHSRGGTISIIVGALNPHVVAFAPIMATYGEATPPDPEAIRTGIKVSYRDLPPGNNPTKEKKKFLLPLNYFTDAKKYPATEMLRKCTKPKLIFYGTADEFTTPERVKEVYENIPEPKMIHELNTVHDYRLKKEIIKEVNRITGEFLDKYFK